MKENSEPIDDVAAKKKAEARATRWFGIIFGGLIVLLIAVMAGIDIYMDKVNGNTRSAPSDAADR